jgi:AcrR family transcriptional regulator
LVLKAAEALLSEGGPAAVTVRAVAERVGMTDMGVNHHFGSRDGLLRSLLDHLAEHFRIELATFTAKWQQEGAPLAPLVDLLSGSYKAGFTQLAIAMHAAGWRDRRSPLLEPVVQALHAARMRRPGARLSLDDTRLAVAAMHQALALEPLFGAEFRRSAGVPGRKAADPAPQRRWWLETMAERLGIP